MITDENPYDDLWGGPPPKSNGDPFQPTTPSSTPSSSAGESPYGIGFWQNRGYTTDQMFDQNGQMRPGWTRTGSGYMYNGGAPTTTGGRHPNAGPDGSSQPNMDPPGYRGGYWMGGQWVQGSPYGGGGSGGPQSTEMPAEWMADLPAPEYQNAPAWVFDPFKPSSWEDAENEPGYKASREQLKKQIEAGAAYSGMVRSGMTIGDLYSNLDALSQQNFKQFDDRRYRNWTGNRDLSMAQHRFLVDDIERQNNFRFNVWDRRFQDRLARWTEQVRSLTTLARPVD